MMDILPCPTCRDAFLVDRYKGQYDDYICHSCMNTFDREDVHMCDRAQRDKPYSGGEP